MTDLTGSLLLPYLQGALSHRITAEGVQPLRLSDSAMDHTHDALRTPVAAEACNAIRLRFQTEATSVTIEVTLVVSDRTAYALRVGGMSAPALDLRVDNSLHQRTPVPHDTLPHTITFDDLPGDHAVVELWLPHNVGAIIHRLSANAPLHHVPELSTRWVLHGSSISHDALAEGPSDTWPARLARAQGWSLTHLGFRGECHLDPFVAREIARVHPDVVTLELGINVHNFQSMRQRTFRPAVHGFLQTIRDTLPETPLSIISPVFGAEREVETSSLTLEGTRLEGDLTLPIIRTILREAVEMRRQAGDRTLSWINGLDLLGPRDADLFPDGLHPNSEGGRLLAERLAPLLSSGVSTGGPGARLAGH